MPLFDELKRRNVFRVALAYLVVGWLLTEVLTTILPTLGAPDWTPRAVILIFAFGFIPAIVLSWFYELTPEGIKRDHEVRQDGSGLTRAGNTLQWVTIAGAVILVVFLGFFGAQQGDDAASPTGAAVSEASVAVLPFVNLSSDPDNEYFSDGLTETLLHMLTQHPELKVAARTSSFAFKNQDRTIVEIARLLGVAHVLEGSVQRVGDRVRVTAQLIRADDGFHVWSETYDLTFDDIFGIQDQIAEKVGSALTASLLGESANVRLAGVATESADAYDLYLMALNERVTFSYGGLRAAEDLLKGALTIDPDFLEAKTELASVYLHQVETGLLDRASARTEITAIADQVLAERPDNVDAYAIKIYVDKAYVGEQPSPEETFELIEQLEEIVAQNPSNYQPRLLLTRMLQSVQRNDRAVEVLQEALSLDPFNPRILYELGSLYAAQRDWENARAAVEKSLQIEPEQPNAYATLAIISLQNGDGLEYLRKFLQAIKADPKDHELPGRVAVFLYNLDLVDEGDDFRDRVLAIAPTSEMAYQVNLARAIATGDREAGVASARRAIEDDVPNRNFAFGGAVQYLLRDAIRRDETAEVLDYLEEAAPGIFDIEADSPQAKFRAAQFVSLEAWFVTLSRDELDSRLVAFNDLAVAYGFDAQENPQVMFVMATLRGDSEGAIKLLLDEFADDTPLRYPGWQELLQQPQYADVVADPRVQVVMQSWEEEEARVRDQVRAFLADLQATT
jgi:TolB-like protein/Tfp pilus assembly protein PilF